MRRIIKPALSRFIAVILLTFGTASASAQYYYLNVFQKNGTKVEYVIADLDSINITRMPLSVSLDKSDISMNEGDQVKLTARVQYGNRFVDESVEWTSDNTKVVTVDNDGVVTAVATGTAIITASFQEMEAKCKVTVENNKSKIIINYYGCQILSDHADINIYADNQLVAADGFGISTLKKNWKSASCTIGDDSYTLEATDGASFSSNDKYGKYYWTWAFKNNTVRSALMNASESNPVTVTMTDVKDNQYVFIYNENQTNTHSYYPYDGSNNTDPESIITSLTLETTSISLIIGVWDSLKATAFNGNEKVDSAAIIWKSDNESVATVDSTGLLRAISVGSATIKATCGDKYATCFVTVLNHNDVTHEYVDLGLSVKWATCNVGAINPEDHGGYYAWGETESKIKYEWENYKWCDGWWTKLTKYNYSGGWGSTDNKKILDPEDDVVQANWGDNWRMPTSDELKELIDNCTWTWTTVNGKKGYRITSNKTGYTDRYIFLPAYGYINYSDYKGYGQKGYYVSNTIGNSFNPGWVDCLVFDSENKSVTANNVGRNYGFSVRPVCPKETTDDTITSLTLDSTSISIIVGVWDILTANAFNGDEVVDTVVINWQSDDESVVTVDSTGFVRAISVGSATIKATCGDKFATCVVTVLDHNDFVHEYVDLGLSVKWATCNVGAIKPEDHGGYYAWGETEIKTECTWATYKFRISGDSFTNVKLSKYNYDDDVTTLEPEDDVAHVKWGENWRLPSDAEQKELKTNCTWTWYDSDNTEFNGVPGYKVTSNIEGYTDHFIFLPAAGYWYDAYKAHYGVNGYYWSSSLTGMKSHANYLKFDSVSITTSNIGSRRDGNYVRPVCP